MLAGGLVKAGYIIHRLPNDRLSPSPASKPTEMNLSPLMPMKPAFDTLLKWSAVLLLLPVSWSYFQPERSSPWLFRACQVLFFIISLLRSIYWYRTRKGPWPGGTALGEPAEK